LVTLAATGCAEKTITVRRYPSFYTPELTEVAVMPFRNETSRVAVGERFATSLAQALRDNGTYRVIGPRELKDTLRNMGVGSTTRPSGEEIKEGLLRIKGLQAVITGTVLVYQASRTEFNQYAYYPPAYYPYYPEDWAFWPEWDAWEDEAYIGATPEYVQTGQVSVQASMRRLPGMSVIYSTQEPVTSDIQLTSFWPRPAQDVLQRAVDQVANRLVARLAVVPVKITVNISKDLRTATGRTDGKWDFSDTFHPNQDLFIVLNLPQAAKRDTFRLTITPEDNPDHVIVERNVIWEPARAEQGVVLPAREIVDQAGPGDYAVDCYYDGKLVMSHDFQIR